MNTYTQPMKATFQLNKLTGAWSRVLSSGALTKERYAPLMLRKSNWDHMEVIRSAEIVTYILSYRIVHHFHSEAEREYYLQNKSK